MPMLALPLEDYLESGNKSSPRGSSHGLDSLIHRQSRSKRISNWMGYKALGQRWQASNNIGRAVSVAHQGLGYSTQWAWDAGPQLLYVASQPSQAPQGGMVKAAVAHRPDLWVSSAVINAVNGVTPTRTDTSVTHVNLMPEGGTKHVDIGPERYNEKYSYPGMPTEVPRVGYAVPDGCTIERTANGRALRFLDSEGVQYMHTQDAYGWWGSAEVSVIIQNTGGVELVPQGEQLILGKTYTVFDLVPVAAEWSTSFGQVHIDPNVTISGAASIEDAGMSEFLGSWNLGAWTIQGFATSSSSTSGNRRAQLLRYDETQIPAGNITLHRYDMWRIANSSSINSNGAKWFAVKAANPWAQGTHVAIAVTGESAWDWYSRANAWAGLAGGELSGTDYHATQLGAWTWSGYTSGADVEIQTTLTNQSAEDWRDAVIPNEGMIAHADSPDAVTSWMISHSVDSATAAARPSVYFEYTEITGNPHYYYNMLKRRR